MYADRDFTATGSDETEIYTFDFVNTLGAAEVITSSVWTVSVKVGKDAQASTRLVGPAVINATATSQLIGPLVNGATYRITATITTNYGQTLSLFAHLSCVAPK